MSGFVALPHHLIGLGFERNPFPQTPDADAYFCTDAIEQQFIEALHCIKVGKGFMLLTGEVGTGKSTFLRRIMDDLVLNDCAISFVFNTFLQGHDLLKAINRDFGLTPGSDFAEDIDLLNHFLIEQSSTDRCCVVVIDDAQNLSAASLELLRLLSNLETRQNKLLQIVLSGQPELLLLLGQTESRQLASRIVQHIQLQALKPSECQRYIDFRLARSGSDGKIQLTETADAAIYRHSKGNPRRVHLIMDRCLYGVSPDSQYKIDKTLVETAASESGIAQFSSRTSNNKTFLLAASTALAFVLAGTFLWLPVRGATEKKVTAVVTDLPALKNQRTVPPMAITPENPNKQNLQACLKNIHAESWLAELENGLKFETRRTSIQSLAQEGLVLAVLPTGLRPLDSKSTKNTKSAQGTSEYCSWENSVGSWVLWRPAHFPFELNKGAQSDSVLWLQEQLEVIEIYKAALDGISGSRTLAALNLFQRQNGLSVSASVEPWTLFLLENTIRKPTQTAQPIKAASL
jgi:general secretion pathway protein A